MAPTGTSSNAFRMSALCITTHPHESARSPRSSHSPLQPWNPIPSPSGVPLAVGFRAAQSFAIAASVERWSGHPLAEAVMRAAAAAGIRPSASGAFRSMPGKGATASVDGGAVSVGNGLLLDDLGVRPGRDLLDRAAAEESGGRTVAFVVSAGRAVGLLSFADSLDPTAAEAVRLLRADGVDLVLCTGDSAGAAAAAANALGIERVESRRSPAEKAEVVRRLQEAGS